MRLSNTSNTEKVDDHDEDCSDHRRKPGFGLEIARQLDRSGATAIIGARDPREASKPRMNFMALLRNSRKTLER